MLRTNARYWNPLRASVWSPWSQSQVSFDAPVGAAGCAKPIVLMPSVFSTEAGHVSGKLTKIAADRCAQEKSGVCDLMPSF